MADYMSLGSSTVTDTTDVHTAINQGLIQVTVVGNQEQYECLVCHRSMAGLVPAESHLKGSPHFKALRNYRYSCSLGKVASVLRISEETEPNRSHSPEIPAVISSTTSDFEETEMSSAKRRKIVTEAEVNGIVHITCNICNITCTGEEPMKQHLIGEKHNKKRRMLNQQGDVPEVDSCISRSPSSSSVDLKTVSTKVKSIFAETPKANSEFEDPLKKAMQEGLVTCEISNGVEKLTCQLCHKDCSGRVPMNQHLVSRAHLRKLSTLDTPAVTSNMRHTDVSSMYSGKLDQGPSLSTLPSSEKSVASLTSASEVSKNQAISDPIDNAIAEGVIIEREDAIMCMVCQLSCTGRLPMTEHLLGDHHRKKLRDQIEYQLQMLQGSSSTISKVVSSQPSTISPAAITTGQVVDISKPNKNVFQKHQLDRVSPNRESIIYRGSSVDTSAESCHEKSLHLPPNLHDLDVYYPDEPLGCLM